MGTHAASVSTSSLPMDLVQLNPSFGCASVLQHQDNWCVRLDIIMSTTDSIAF